MRHEFARAVSVPVIALLVALPVTLSGGCRKQSERPRVVGTTPAPGETSTGTPLADITIALESVATGLKQPLYATGAGDGTDRLFVVEKAGRIRVVENGDVRKQPFLDIADKVSSGGEQGLLGLAFPEDFEDSRWCIVSYTNTKGTSVISRFDSDGDSADPDSEEVLLTLAQPYANHNGGMVTFGPDGYLYIGFGDGGSAGDPQGNGQNLRTLLGKILRVDVRDRAVPNGKLYDIPPDNPFVNVGDARPEIWAYGLRNPWRFSFDRITGDLWIGDVGQNRWEEIDFQPASSTGGENYGWDIYEAAHTHPGGKAAGDVSGFVRPVVEYDRKAGSSVTGGYVYRGDQHPTLRGTYLYADFTEGRIWGLQRGSDGTVRTRLLLDTDLLISSFGEDDNGELCVTDLNGGVHRITTE